MSEKPDKTWDFRQIIDWIEQHDKQELIDEVVINTALSQATNVNNQRVSKQVEWLIQQVGWESAKKAILEVLDA